MAPWKGIAAIDPRPFRLNLAVRKTQSPVESAARFARASRHADRAVAKAGPGDMAALADFRHACELNERDEDYPRLYIWIIRAHPGETEAANKELTAFLDHHSKPRNEWMSNMDGFLLGTLAEAELFAAAASPDAKKEIGQRCEAWYFAGMKKLLAGDKTAAAEDLRQCLATDQKDFVEYQLAEAEIKALAP